MIDRHLARELQQLASEYRIVTLTGPRQAGKTTLTRQTFPDYTYVSLEDPDQRALANDDPRAFLALWRPPVILDEIQRVPSLLSYLQTRVDDNPAKGQYILTGSHQLALSEAISQSLAGRTALLTLYPLSMAELDKSDLARDTDSLMHRGFLPAIHAQSMDATRYYRNYYQTYVERDVRQMLLIRDMLLFDKFVRLCAGRIGQLFVASQLANEVGVSIHTIQHWLSVLEASFIIHRLPPFHENIGKRLVKAFKLYFVDVGLAAWLLGIETASQIQRDPLRGALFENLVVMELIKARANQGQDPQLFFYRDSNGNEVDALFKRGRRYTPIEIKSAATFHQRFLKGLEAFRRAYPEGAELGFLIYDGAMSPSLEYADVVNVRDAAHVIQSR